MGQERHWALALIPREDVVISELAVPPVGRRPAPPRQYRVRKNLEDYARTMRGQFGAGPEVRLWQKLSDFSLNAYKDMAFDFDEILSPYDPQAQRYSYEDYWVKGEDQGRTLRDKSNLLVQRYWDHSGDLQHAFGHHSRMYFKFYANSRAAWTQEQRKQVRSILIFIANCAAGDSFSPHTSMMGGHPNFIAEIKYSMPLAAAVFPTAGRPQAMAPSTTPPRASVGAGTAPSRTAITLTSTSCRY